MRQETNTSNKAGNQHIKHNLFALQGGQRVNKRKMPHDVALIFACVAEHQRLHGGHHLEGQKIGQVMLDIGLNIIALALKGEKVGYA